jgi:hypothetical protein
MGFNFLRAQLHLTLKSIGSTGRLYNNRYGLANRLWVSLEFTITTFFVLQHHITVAKFNHKNISLKIHTLHSSHMVVQVMVPPLAVSTTKALMVVGLHCNLSTAVALRKFVRAPEPTIINSGCLFILPVTLVM